MGSREQYLQLHRESVEDPGAFWGRIADEFYWKDAPTSVLSHSNFDVREGAIDGEREARQREARAEPSARAAAAAAAAAATAACSADPSLSAATCRIRR